MMKGVIEMSMSKNDNQFGLNVVHFDKMCFEIAHQDNSDESVEASISIEASIEDNENNYKENNIVKVRLVISGYIKEVKVDMIIFTEIVSRDNNEAFEIFIQKELSELVRPGLNKASITAAQVIENFVHFPIFVDFYQEFISNT